MENRITHIHVHFKNECKCLLCLVYCSPTEEGHSWGNAKLPTLPCQGAFTLNPEWPSLKVKHQLQLLTSLASHTQEIITSKSQILEILLYTKTLLSKCCNVPSNRTSTTHLKGFFMTTEKLFLLQFLVLGSERVVQIHDLTAPTDYSKGTVTDNCKDLQIQENWH